jgi:glutamate dehydrogenase/leucine dehydrogenase
MYTLLQQAREVFRKRGLLFGPHKATLAGSALVSGLELESNPILPGQVYTYMHSIHSTIQHYIKLNDTDGLSLQYVHSELASTVCYALYTIEHTCD